MKKEIIRNTILLGAAVVGMSRAVRDAPPQDYDNRYYWAASATNGDGCLTVAGIQWHDVVPGEHVALYMNSSDEAIDFSEKSVSLFLDEVCVSPETIVFTAVRDGTEADPSVYSPAP